MSQAASRTTREDVRSPTGLESCPAVKPGLVEIPLDSEIVVYDPQADALHRLDPTASVVWSHLDGAMTLGTLTSRVAASYRMPVDVVRSDVVRLARSLWDRGLLAGSPTASKPRMAASPLASTRHELDLGDRPLPDAPCTTPRYRALEHAFEIATNDAAVRDYLADVLVELADAVPGAAARYELLDHATAVDHGQWRYLIRYDGDVLAATQTLERALSLVLGHINSEAVRRSAPRYPLVHAAAAVRDGVAVLLPAPAGSGKTTTVAGLVNKAGFDYLTDEAVAIDPATLLAQPYPKALSVDEGSWEALADLQPAHAELVDGQWQVPARDIRPGAVAAPAPVGFVVAPTYGRDATTRLEPMSRGQMLVHLADSTFRLQDAPQRNLDVLSRMLQHANCYRLELSDLDDAVRLVAELV